MDTNATATVKVYRIENDAGRGPYGSRGPGLPYDLAVHPAPWSEVDSFGFSDLFGFASMEQYNSWFSEDLIEMLLNQEGQNWMLSTYEVPEDSVQITPSQAIFDPKAAIRVNRVDLS